MDTAKQPIKHRPNLRRLKHAVLIAAFLTIICLPGIGMILCPQQASSQSGWEESRAMPKLTWRLSSIMSFPEDFGEYFRFNFGFRRTLIHWHTLIVGKTKSKNSSSQVVEGKHGWLFYGDPRTVNDYRGMLPFAPEQLQQWQQTLQRRRDWLATIGVRYLFVVGPDKHTIYPEYMPGRLNRVHNQTRLDQFMQYMKKHSTVDVLDLRPILWEQKMRHLCYQPQETHWNGVGAFFGYQEIARHLRTWFPALHVFELDECEFYKREVPETDLLRLQGRENTRTFMDSVNLIQRFSTPLWVDANAVRVRGDTVLYSHRDNAPVKRALVIGDSFSSSMIPFLSESFGDVMYVWGGGDGFDPQDVLDFQPDVVIQEIVERGLCEATPRVLELPPVPTGEYTVRQETSDPNLSS